MNPNPDPVPYQQPIADKVRAVVMTHAFRLEGNLHFPRLGKEARRLSNLMNSDRRFVAMTNVTVTERATGVTDPTAHPLIHINVASVEFVQPHINEVDAARETQ